MTNDTFALLRDLAHTPDATRAQRAEAVRAALPAVAAGCAVTRDYLREVAKTDVAPAAARALDAACRTGAAALACAYQVSTMRGDGLHVLIRYWLWVEEAEINEEPWITRGRSRAQPDAERHPARARRRWTATVGQREYVALSWQETKSGAKWGGRLQIGRVLRGSLEGTYSHDCHSPDAVTLIRAAVSALRPSELLGGGWISARLDLERNDPAALRLARLPRREEEV